MKLKKIGFSRITEFLGFGVGDFQGLMDKDSNFRIVLAFSLL
jgi:hypothetical protein